MESDHTPKQHWTKGPPDERKSIAEQIACVEREIRIRQFTYGQFIVQHKMSSRKVVHELDCMKCVLETLKRVELQHN